MGVEEVRWECRVRACASTDTTARTQSRAICGSDCLTSTLVRKSRKCLTRGSSSSSSSSSIAFSRLAILCIFVVLPSIITCSGATVSPELARRIEEDLETRNISICDEHLCHPDSKRPRLEEDWNDRGCMCDKACATFSDCCRDVTTDVTSREDITCLSLRQYDGIYMVSACPADFADPEVARLCAEPAPLMEDPFGGMPVSSPRSQLTYRNYYCAMCNNDVINAVFWRPRVECPTLKQSVRNRYNVTDAFTAENLEQNGEGVWGVTLVEGAIENFHPCVIDPFFPETVEYFVRRCRVTVDSCDSSWSDDEVAELCKAGYTAYVYDFDNTIYRNPHCALCSGIPAEEQFCLKRPMFRSGLFGNHFNARSFSILLDIGDSSGSEDVGVVEPCTETQLWDPFFKKCRDVVCDADGYRLVDGVCLASQDNITITTPFLLCPKYYLNESEYQFGENDTIYVSLYDRHYGAGEYELRDGELVICAISKDLSKFDTVLSYISLICLAGSVICLFLHILAFCCVPEIQNLSGKNLASLAVCLLIGYLCFLVGPQLEGGTSDCRSIAIAMYTSFMASFFWMNVMAFDVFTTLRRATKELRMSGENHVCRFIVYNLYVMFMTLALVVAAVLCETSPLVPVAFKPGFGARVCWFSRRKALMVFFAVPLAVVMATNVVMFLASANMIRATTQSTAKMTCGPSQVNLRLYSRLAVIMGLSWVVGLAAGWLDFQPLWYVFVVLNALQGVFIFCSFTMAKKVKDRVARRAASWHSGGLGGSGGARSIADSNVNTDSSALSVQQRTKL